MEHVLITAASLLLGAVISASFVEIVFEEHQRPPRVLILVAGLLLMLVIRAALERRWSTRRRPRREAGC